MHGHHRGGGSHGRGPHGRGAQSRSPRGGGPHHHPYHGNSRHGGMEEKMGRLLGHGDLRYVILHLLDEKPRHGYEVIKALEELSSGAYSPSPGSIYPTLTFLEEGGFASATIDENKKLYAITAQGRVLLKENRAFVDELMARFAHASERLSRLKHWMGREEAEEIAKTDKSVIRKAMHGLKAELFSFLDAREEQKKKVAAIIDRATEEIRKLKG